jgi:hypothetical protein
MKMDAAHLVPLADDDRAILESLCGVRRGRQAISRVVRGAAM